MPYAYNYSYRQLSRLEKLPPDYAGIQRIKPSLLLFGNLPGMLAGLRARFIPIHTGVFRFILPLFTDTLKGLNAI